MKESRFWIVFGMCGLALLPYILLCGYVMPLADDYCMGWEAMRRPQLIEAASYLYRHMNGRFASNALLLLNPLRHYGIAGYECAALLLLVAMLGVFYLLTGVVLSKVKDRLLCAMLLLLYQLYQMPDISEGVYWYSGYVIYMVSALLMTIWGLAMYYASTSERKPMSVLARCLAVLLPPVIAGCNEPMAVLMVLLTSVLCIRSIWSGGKWRLNALCSMMAIAGLLMVLNAPGSSARAAQYHNDHSMIKALVMTHLQILRFGADWVSSLPTVLLGMVVVMRSGRMNLKGLDHIKLWWMAVAMYVVMVVCIILPYWYTGVLGQQRTINLAYYLSMMMGILMLMKYARSKSGLRLLAYLHNDNMMQGMLVAAIVLMMLTKNGYKVGYDLAYGNMPKYKAEQMERSKLLTAHLHEEGYKLPPRMIKPLSITIYDEELPQMKWVQECQCLYLQGDSAGR